MKDIKNNLKGQEKLINWLNSNYKKCICQNKSFKFRCEKCQFGTLSKNVWCDEYGKLKKLEQEYEELKKEEING